MSETTSMAERAAILDAQLAACRVQRDEAVARRDALAGENERLRAALGAAKDEVARLREELRVVSRYAARLYDDVTEVSEALDAACYDDSPDAMGTARDRLDEALGVSDGIGVWTEALKRGREGR